MFPMDSNETKKFIAQLYNEISKELFGVGTTFLKVIVDQNIITIHAKHRRSQRSAALEGEVPSLKQEVDFHLCLLYKKKLKQKFEEQTNWDIKVLLRDYDSATQLAFTNIVL
ncbi:MAG: DUF2294 domain-containing protein [Bacillus sp. (in: Bacteria)]|nr:DUF2294 domain-containing protein [Bacillus sp. (in: firmicutes)]